MKRQTRNMNTTLTLVLVLAVASHAMAQSAAPPNLRFQRFDKNGDGKLSQEEFPYPYVFKRYDKDGDGMLSPEEAAEIKVIGRQVPTAPGTTDTPTPKTTPAPATAADFKPRAHGDEATRAGLKPDVLAKLDIALQQAVANKEVSGVIGLIHRNGERGYFEAFGWQDIEAGKSMAKDAIFRLQSMSKPVVTAGALRLLDEGKFDLDEPISKHVPEWKEPTVQEHGLRIIFR